MNSGSQTLSLLGGIISFTVGLLVPRTMAESQQEPIDVTVNAEYFMVAEDRSLVGLIFEDANTPQYLVEFTTPTPTNTPTPTSTNTPTPTPSPSPSPTSTPTPSPTPITVNGGQIDAWFDTYASEYSVDGNTLRRIARCESGFNTNSASGPYGGMFQFHSDTWISTRTQMGRDTNPDLRFNPEEAIRTAAWKISRGGQSAWPNC